MTQSAQTALTMLLDSRDGTPAAIWHDGGRTITRLARTAVVRVTFAHVDMTTGTTEYRTVDGGAA